MTDTYGFDLAFASTVDMVNRQLAAYFSETTVRFAYDGDDATDHATITLSATSAAWRVVPGGSNKLVRFAVPLADGTLVVDAPDEGIDKASYPLAGVTVTVELQLGWLGPSRAIATTGEGGSTDLAFYLARRGRGLGDTTPGAVTVISVTAPSGALPPIASAVLDAVFADVLVASRQQIGHVFATIVPAPSGDTAWMTPSTWDYFYQESAGGPSVLCVLAVLDDRGLPPTPAFDASVLVTGADTFVVLSGRQFLDHALLPELPTAYPGGQFTLVPLTDTTAKITNNGAVPTRTTSWGLDTYYPHIDDYTLTIDGSDLVTSVSGRCDITGLANAYITFSGTKRATTTYSPDTGSLSTGSPSGTIGSSKHIPWYDWVFGVLSGGVGIAIIDGVIAAVTDTVTASVGQVVSTTVESAVTATALTVCQWAGPTATPVAGALSGALWVAASSARH